MQSGKPDINSNTPWSIQIRLDQTKSRARLFSNQISEKHPTTLHTQNTKNTISCGLQCPLPIIMTYYPHVILSTCHTIYMPHYPHATLSSWHTIYMPHTILMKQGSTISHNTQNTTSPTSSATTLKTTHHQPHQLLHRKHASLTDAVAQGYGSRINRESMNW